MKKATGRTRPDQPYDVDPHRETYTKVEIAT